MIFATKYVSMYYTSVLRKDFIIKKIYAVIALCMALEIGITGCGTSAPKEKVTSLTESTGNEELDKALENTKDYSALDYVTLGDYKGVEVSTYVSDEDVESKNWPGDSCCIYL